MLTEDQKHELSKKIAFEMLKKKAETDEIYTLEEAAALGIVADELTEEELADAEAAHDDYIWGLVEEADHHG